MRSHVLSALLLVPAFCGGSGTPAGASTLTCSVLQEGPSLLDCGGLHFSRVLKEPHLATEAGELQVGSDLWFFFAGCALSCVVCAALAAGLTLGLTSIEEFELRVLCNHLIDEVEPNATPSTRLLAQRKLVKDQKCASRILPLISGTYFKSSSNSCVHNVDPTNQHYLLVTLLLLNATANEALPLFLDKLVPSWMACILSVTVVLFFGEIIPSAVFTGPRQLSLAAGLSPLVACAKLLFVPIVWPISLMLDKVLGHVSDPYSRAQIKALIRTIRADDSSLEIDEANMIQGVLEMHHKKAENIAHSLKKARMVAHDRIITPECVDEIMNWGHSRLFVYRRDPLVPERRDDIIGVVLVKKLLNVSYESRSRMDSLMHAMKWPVVLHPHDNLLTTLNKFQAGTCHLAVISADPEACLFAMRQQETIPAAARPTLFCSLEDVIEALLKEEIYDEEDKELGRHARRVFCSGDSSTRSQNLMLNIKLRPQHARRFRKQFTRIGSRVTRATVSEKDLKTYLLEEGLEGSDSSIGESPRTATAAASWMRESSCRSSP